MRRLLLIPLLVLPALGGESSGDGALTWDLDRPMALGHYATEGWVEVSSPAGDGVERVTSETEVRLEVADPSRPV